MVQELTFSHTLSFPVKRVNFFFLNICIILYNVGLISLSLFPGPCFFVGHLGCYQFHKNSNEALEKPMVLIACGLVLLFLSDKLLWGEGWVNSDLSTNYCR